VSTVNIYVKKQLRLDLLTIPQRKMYDIGVAGLESIKQRVAKAYGVTDSPAAPLKSESWKRIKKSRGLKPIRDLHGTGMMWPEKGGKRKAKLKNVGHLMDQLSVRKVSDNRAYISEPTTRAGRVKARRNRDMLGFSLYNRAAILRAVQVVIGDIKNKIIKTISRGQK
jgi:hypothetical protein